MVSSCLLETYSRIGDIWSKSLVILDLSSCWVVDSVDEPAFVFGENKSRCNTTAMKSTIKKKSNAIAYHFVWEGIARQMVDYVCEYWWKRGWYADKAFEWPKVSQSLFGCYCSTYFLRRKSRGYGRRVSAFLWPPRIGTTCPFYIYFNTHGVLLRVRVGARGLLFTRFFLIFLF